MANGNGSGGAGAGYDISPATARASGQSAQQEAGTIIVFGNAGSVSPAYDFTSDLDPTATASTSKGNNPGGSSAPAANSALATPFFGSGSPWPLLALGAGLLIVILYAQSHH